MATLDWAVVGGFFLLMVFIGYWSSNQISNTDDFFTAGGKMPWWLSGISHHMSGYSAAVFVAYAAVAYKYGFTIYIWWAVPISIACFIGAFVFAPRWARMRTHLKIESPLEYLAIRYNVPTQQLMAWSGALLKLIDVGAKWASIGIILNVFTGVPIIWGIAVSGAISMFYATIGGLWADALTDFAQFIVQTIAGLAMFYIVALKLGGWDSVFTLWDRLPPGHGDAFSGPYDHLFVFAFTLVVILSYNGGTWNLAQRYIASPSSSQAKRAALLSGILYLIWPLILFFPMWAAPLIYPNLADPSQSYSKMAMELLPPGIVGLVLASMFAHTMAMTTSDANAVTAVITRDIFPRIWKGYSQLSEKASLKAARIVMFTFMITTCIIAVFARELGGVLALLVTWFGALVGPVSIAMLLGLLPWFRYSGPTAANVALIGGVLAFTATKFGKELGITFSTSMIVALPILVSSALYIGLGWINKLTGKEPSKEVNELIDKLSKD